MLGANVEVSPRTGSVQIAGIALRYRAAAAIATAFLLLTGALAFRLSISQDEAYSLHTSASGLLEGLRQGLTYEAQAPLYFGALAVWRLIGTSLFDARLFSLALSAITLVYSWRFAQRFITGIPPSVVLAVVAFNPFMIWATIEARPYAAAITLSTALLYYAFRGWIDDDLNWTARASFVAVAVAGAYTQYYIVTLVAAVGIAIVVFGDWRRLPSYFAASGIVGLTLIPLVFILPGQLGAYSALAAISELPGYAIVLALIEFLYPHHWMGSWTHPVFRTLLYFSIGAIPIVLLLGWIRTITRQAQLLAMTTISLTVIFGMFIGIGHIHVIFPRQTAVLFAPTIFTAFALAGGTRAERRSQLLKVFGAIYAALVILSYWSDYRGLSKLGDWNRVADYLQSHVASNDAVVAFDPEVVLPLGYYYHTLPIGAIPRPLQFERFDEEDFVIRNERDLERSIGRAAIHRRHVWLVLNELCGTLPSFYGCSRLEAYVARHFTTLRVVPFNGSSVSELAPVDRAGMAL